MGVYVDNRGRSGYRMLAIYRFFTGRDLEGAFLRWVSLLRLLRLSNSLPAAILVLLGAYLVSPGLIFSDPTSWSVWMAAATMWLVTAFGYVSNDLLDWREDQVNKPDRPLPAGLIPFWLATTLALTLAVGALFMAFQISLLALGAAGSALALLTVYTLRLKATPLLGNLLIALMAGAALLVGPYLAGTMMPLLAPAGVLSAFIAARETLKTIEDIPGDRMAGKRTVAVQWGERRTLHLVALYAGLTLLLSWLPLFTSGFDWPYLVVMLVGVDGVLLYSLLTLYRQLTPDRVSRCLALLKASYFAGILALILA